MNTVDLKEQALQQLVQGFQAALKANATPEEMIEAIKKNTDPLKLKQLLTALESGKPRSAGW